MLVAFNSKGEIVAMNEEWSRESLMKIRNRETFYCPSCKEIVLLKIGNHRIPHFAHLKKMECDSFSEGESPYHKEGKVKLCEWLKGQGYSPQLEPYFVNIKQRPDVFVSFENLKYTIEFQCSKVDFNKFKERTDNYIRNGYKPIWILGGNRIKRKSKTRFTLTPFDWLFIKLFGKNPSILYYCTEINKFLLLHILFPLSSNTVIGSLTIISPQQIKFQNLYKPPIPEIRFPIEEWLNMKKNWRLRCTQFPANSTKKFLTYLYSNELYPSLIPSEAGIPVPSMYLIETPTMIWQTWILLEFIQSNPIDSQFTFQSVFQFIKLKKKSRQFFIRDLPQLSNVHYSFAIMEYLNKLVDIGLLKHVNNKTFKKVKSCLIPKRIEDALVGDKEILRLINK